MLTQHLRSLHHHSAGLLLLVAALPSQTLVKDINPGTGSGSASSSPAEFVTAGGQAFFVATDRAYGRELHATDGTLLGTRLVRDLEPGANGVSPSGLTAIGTKVVFVAQSVSPNRGFFVSDGTSEGTRPLRTDLSLAHDPVKVGARVFFGATHAATGNELWVTDGTSPGTTLAADLNPGTSQSNLQMLGDSNGLLLFLRTTGTDLELWRSDGTPAGTAKVAGLPGSGNASLRTAAAVGGQWLFALGYTSTNNVLWATDGTAAGTRMVAPVGTSAPRDLTAVGGRAFFVGGDAATGQELWSSDGTAAGTGLVLDIRPGATNSLPSELVAWQNALWFSADDGVHGRKLWRSDGTAAGTALFFDSGKYGLDTTAGSIHVHNGTLVFAAEGQLWSSDGTAAGTHAFTGFNPAQSLIGQMSSFGNVMLFAGNGGQGLEPWRTDLTGGGTALLKDVHSPEGDSSFPTPIVSYGGRVFFPATADSNGPRLWTSDGTPAGTMQQPGATANGCSLLTVFQGHLYYRGTVFTGLLRTDGTAAGTIDVAPGAGLTGLDSLVVAGNRLFFVAAGALGYELCVSDGTAAGTHVVKDIRPGSASSYPTQLTVVGSRVFFVANDGVAGNELWVSDGTAAGTTLVADLMPGASSSTIADPVAFAGELWFVATDAAHGRELWHSDGTLGGTQVLDLYPGTASTSPVDLAVFQGKLFFGGLHPTLGNEPWVSDGTPAGTNVLVNLASGSNGSTPTGFFASSTRLWFVAYDNVAGNELFCSDGTAAGTRLVKDILPGTASSRPKELVALPGGAVVFAATDAASGEEAWRSDGTEAGTFRLTDIAPGALSASPAGFCVHGSQIFFSAKDQLIGRELWVMPLDGKAAASVELYGTGCPGSDSLVPALEATGVPTLGNAGFSVLLTQGRASSGAAIMLAAGSSNIPLNASCALLLLPPILVMFPVSTTVLGTAELPLPVPASAGLAGGRLSLQGAVLDPNGAWQGLVSFSNGVRLTVGK